MEAHGPYSHEHTHHTRAEIHGASTIRHHAQQADSVPTWQRDSPRELARRAHRPEERDRQYEESPGSFMTTKKQPKPKPKSKLRQPNSRAKRSSPVTTSTDPHSSTQPDPHSSTQAPTTQTPTHYSPGTVAKTAPQEGAAPQQTSTPTVKESALPPAPAGMKPNEAVQMPPGSVQAQSSYPGGTPPVDLIFPAPPPPAGQSPPADQSGSGGSGQQPPPDQSGSGQQQSLGSTHGQHGGTHGQQQ